MQWIHAVLQRILHIILSKERHGVHSPLVYQLMERDLKIPLSTDLNIIDGYRKQLLNDHSTWTSIDHGAGSRLKSSKLLSTAVRRASSNRKKGNFLFRWVKRFQPRTVIELGTHVGIGTAYLQLGNLNSQITTLEGDPFLANIAQTFFRDQHWPIHTVVGSFDEHLESTLKSISPFDLVVIDGNHTRDATLRYVQMLLPHASPNAWILLDDIHWSKDMSTAWSEIVQNPHYLLTLDFYQYGAIFLGKRNQKEHFVLKW